MVIAYSPILTYFLISWPWPLIFDPENQKGSVLTKDAFVYHIWWRYLNVFVSYAWSDIRTDKQTVKRTHLSKCKFWQVINILLLQITMMLQWVSEITGNAMVYSTICLKLFTLRTKTSKSVLPVLYYTMTAADLALQGDRAATAVVLTCTVERRYNAFQYNMILHTVTEPE